MSYRFIEDPGHGWLEVPLSELLTLGIAQKISRYSYQSRDGRTVYLEEDCDAPRFDKAKGPGAKWKVKLTYQDPTFVRSLPHYQPPAPAGEPFDEPGPDLKDDLEDESLTIQAGNLFFLAPERGTL